MTTTCIEPDVNPVNAPFWEALRAGKLTFQRCAHGHAWLPARTTCPTCLSSQWHWETAAGTGRIVSWVVYHHAYHPAFQDQIPYNVALVRLDEGPQLLTNILAPHTDLVADAPVRVVINTDAAQPLARFELVV